jgi:hypothetical protein
MFAIKNVRVRRTQKQLFVIFSTNMGLLWTHFQRLMSPEDYIFVEIISHFK